MPLTVYINDTCPKCRKPIELSYIEAHPSRDDIAVHNFVCGDCGTVKTKIISLRSDNTPVEGAVPGRMGVRR
jgi:hypothetical protein